ncbi:hypothetical protein PoB_005850400 [Plakobranchus ocellatus]|uniref:Uncharacterized protein n=1 Tax=Plakobranchus ocellatus TaxID=259542 RepID=A0AAV4CGX5_9GAST|nr:hypothetical protein PoB_005850400 [Plakobranchus ocellatus]
MNSLNEVPFLQKPPSTAALNARANNGSGYTQTGNNKTAGGACVSKILEPSTPCFDTKHWVVSVNRSQCPESARRLLSISWLHPVHCGFENGDFLFA